MTADQECREQAPGEPASARRLAALQASASDAYAAITAADAALAGLARQRVAAERVLRHAAGARQAAARTAAEHRRARPGLTAELTARFRARSRWRARQARLDAAVIAAEPLLADARRALSAARDQFAAQVQVRAEAVTTLRRLTIACAAARAEITGEATAAKRADGQPGTGEPGAAAGGAG